MAQYSDPSYLLADFPSTDNPPDVHDERDARTIDVSIDSADAPESMLRHAALCRVASSLLST
uniref:Uncharacterized protein n=1 Tax=Gibberella zeae TaxID=5518 RepID=A0A4E9DX27_GIBZA